MPMIYKRFTEKAAEEWRQIYKVRKYLAQFYIPEDCSQDLQGLQLLEFLIKNGSERVIDDARSHLSLIKMLRQFHFIDQNGKDQGVNVRNRSKELSELLGDVDRIRAERKKARSNRNKFGGVEGGAMSGGLSSGSRYGGFGSEDQGSYGAYSGGVYGDGGGYGGNTSGFQDSSSRRDRFEEYDEFDEGAVASSGRRKADTSSTAVKREPKKAEPPKKKEPEIDILGFDDDDIPPETPPKPFTTNGKKAVSNPMDDILGGASSGGADDDDFDDFQSATPTTQSSAPSKPSISNLPPPLSATSPAQSTQYAAPKPVPTSQGANFNDLVGFNSISPAPSMSSTKSAPLPASTLSLPPPMTQPQPQAARPTNYQPAQPNYFTSVPIAPTPASQPSSMGMGGQSKPSLPSSTSFGGGKPAAAKPANGQDVFGSLWSQASAGAGIKKTNTPGQHGPNLASMAKEKASAGIWGAAAGSTSQAQRPAQATGQNGGLDDLLG